MNRFPYNDFDIFLEQVQNMSDQKEVREIFFDFIATAVANQGYMTKNNCLDFLHYTIHPNTRR